MESDRDAVLANLLNRMRRPEAFETVDVSLTCAEAGVVMGALLQVLKREAERPIESPAMAEYSRAFCTVARGAGNKINAMSEQRWDDWGGDEWRLSLKVFDK